MYNLKVDEETARTIAEALEVYARLKIGQLDKISDLFINRDFDREALDYCMKQAKILLFPELHQSSYYGIYNEVTPKDSKIAYDVYKKILYEFNKHRKDYTVHTTPHDSLASDKNITFEKVGDSYEDTSYICKRN